MNKLRTLYSLNDDMHWIDPDMSRAFDRAITRENVIDLIKELQVIESQIPKWTPVDSELPGKEYHNRSVMVRYSEPFNGHGYARWNNDTKWFYEADDTFTLSHISHWMPIPSVNTPYPR